MKCLRRKGICSEYGYSLRTVDNILRDMRESGKYDDAFLKNNGSRGALTIKVEALEHFLGECNGHKYKRRPQNG